MQELDVTPPIYNPNDGYVSSCSMLGDAIPIAIKYKRLVDPSFLLN